MNSLTTQYAQVLKDKDEGGQGSQHVLIEKSQIKLGLKKNNNEMGSIIIII